MSFFSSLFGGGNSAAGYANTQSGLIGDNTALAGSLTNAYDAAARAGAWDPNAQLSQLQADTAYQTGVNSANAAATARTLGYRPGDTAPIQQQQALSNQAALQYADAANQIRTRALQSGYGAAAGLDSELSGIYGRSLNANAGLIGYGERNDAQRSALFSGLLGAATSYLGGLGKGAGTAVSGGYSPDDLVDLGILQGPDDDDPFYR